MAAALTCAALTACATVPVTGPVIPGDGGGPSGGGGAYVRLLPAGPQPGMSPEALVRGFLRDMGSFEEDHEAARSYMVEETARSWSPSGSVQVVGGSESVALVSEPGSDGLTTNVRMSTTLVATIDEDGKYIPSDSGRLEDFHFTLVRENGDPDGEWRVSELPDELILSQLDVERTHRPFNLYYYNREDTALVPDPVYLPVRPTDEMADRLLRRLVRGPTDWLAPAVDSVLPENTVTEVDEEHAEIRVSGVPETGETEYLLGAQIAWTLRQVPGVEEFTLVVNGSEVAFPGADGERAERPRPGSDHWARVSPGAATSGLRAYYMQEGQLWSASELAPDAPSDAERVPGPLGAGDVALERFAVSMQESTIAGITVGGDSVVTSLASADAEIQEVLSDGVFTGVSWDVDRNLWVVEEVEKPAGDEDDGTDGEADQAPAEPEDPDAEPPADGLTAEAPPEPGATALWMLRDGDEVVGVDVSELDDRSVVEFRISRDGTRAAVVTETDGERALEVGRVVVDEDGRVSVGDFITLAGELADVTDLAWRSGDQLVVLGSREGGTNQAFLVSLDGGTPPASAGAPVAGMTSVSGAPGQPLVAGGEDGNVWLSNDRVNWENVVEGASPVYPG
ncbi:LpqB family beta-propeller domain-containing protein [Nocardiopsis sp. FIRDI 009]|uniref:LpqB family beta-propeller domain-containing protein n=1 Tax=Nocardiopsis sp. FIRDI 009 TaxID=714197 RepID=UPI000E26C224|nr:LpqB family beta-propeller domain-containing protein [Nocardiopsis sp. FIRDI 009]